jgi:hypothetical protein
MLSLMAKDDDIARFVYFSAPPTYQHAHYSDWIRNYLEVQKSEIDRSSSYSYFKNKLENILKCLILLVKYEEKVEVFKKEESQAVKKI